MWTLDGSGVRWLEVIDFRHGQSSARLRKSQVTMVTTPGDQFVLPRTAWNYVAEVHTKLSAFGTLQLHGNDHCLSLPIVLRIGPCQWSLSGFPNKILNCTLRLWRRLNSIKFARATSRVRWFNGEKNNVPKTISVIAIRELSQFPDDKGRNGSRKVVFPAIKPHD